ncbi:MAG: hypothetical protein J7577_20795 [Sphingobacteriaceae bacterium]|nr:hypothetical protein [Sphingobacteriaceae bacterium]
MKKMSLMICLWIVGIAVMSGCKKSGDDVPQVPTKTYKFTVKSSGLLADDRISVEFGGSPIDDKVKTIIKVDGVQQDNQYSVELTRAQLTKSGGVVVESVLPIYQMSFILSGYSGTTGHTFAISVDPVVNGVPAASVNKTFTTDTFTQSYNY